MSFLAVLRRSTGDEVSRSSTTLWSGCTFIWPLLSAISRTKHAGRAKRIEAEPGIFRRRAGPSLAYPWPRTWLLRNSFDDRMSRKPANLFLP